MTLAASFVPNRKFGIMPVPNESFLYDYVVQNPATVNWGISFAQQTTPFPNSQYQIWYNATLYASDDDIFTPAVLSVMRAVDEAILSILNDPSGNTAANLDVNLKDWPVIPTSVLADTIVQNLGPVFFFCAVMIIFLNTLDLIVLEKERKQRYGMEMMGLKVYSFNVA